MTPDPVAAAMAHVLTMGPDQLRTIMAHATGLHVEKAGAPLTAQVLTNLGRAVAEPGRKAA